MVGQIGNVNESWGVAAQVGYYSAPDNKYQTIDQTSKILIGASAGMPLSESVNGIVEVFGEKTPSSFPLEMLGLINVKGDNLSWQLGGGTGNIQGSGSNTYKAFVGLTYFFGGSRSTSAMLPTYQPNRKQNREFKSLDQTTPINPIMEDGMDEQQGPEVLEPDQKMNPVIPDINGTSIQPYQGRHLASVGEQPVVNKTKVEIVEVKEEVKEAKKEVKKPKTRMATLPNGQKVKIFEKEINELPKDTKIMFVTEAGYKDLVKKIKEEEKANKERIEKLSKEASFTNPQEVVIKDSKPVMGPVIDDMKDIDVQPVVIELSDKTSNPVLVSPVVKEADPVPMIGETPPKELQSTPVQLVEKPEEIIPVVPVNVEELAKKQQEAQKVSADEKKPVESAVTPIVVETKAEEVKPVEADAVPKVSVTLEQREALKNKILQEFSSDSLEDSRNKISDKVKDEQNKITLEMTKKQEAEAAEKARLEAEALANKAKEEEKEFRENAPLAETQEATPGKAATEEELKPVKIIEKRNRRPIIIELPHAQANAFLEGRKLPTLPAPTGEAKELNLLEETGGDVEEANGPSYGFGDEQ